MDNRERTRLLMAHMRQARRDKGLCVGCGLVPAAVGERCRDCRQVRTLKASVVTVTVKRGYTVDNGMSTSAS